MIIANDDQHALALARCEALIRRKRPSAAELADRLSAAVAAYEDKRWPEAGGFALKPLSAD